MTFKKIIIVLAHAFVGWMLCGATMGIGMSVTSLNNALITSFIQSYSGSQYVTFILAANSTSTGQFRTATREATATATSVLTGLEGSFAPYLSFTVVPEPSSIALLGLGGLALLIRRRS